MQRIKPDRNRGNKENKIWNFKALAIFDCENVECLFYLKEGG